MALRGEKRVLVHQRASEAPGADFLKREMKAGVCRPCVLPSGLGHTPGPPRRPPPGKDLRPLIRTERGTFAPPLPHWFLQALSLQQPPSCRRGSNSGAARPPHYTARPVCSQHLQGHLTEKETEAGDGAGTKKQLVSQAQELRRDQKPSWFGS